MLKYIPWFRDLFGRVIDCPPGSSTHGASVSAANLMDVRRTYRWFAALRSPKCAALIDGLRRTCVIMERASEDDAPFVGMTLVMEEYESADPVDAGSFGTQRVMFASNGLADLVEQFGRLARHVKPPVSFQKLNWKVLR